MRMEEMRRVYYEEFGKKEICEERKELKEQKMHVPNHKKYNVGFIAISMFVLFMILLWCFFILY